MSKHQSDLQKSITAKINVLGTSKKKRKVQEDRKLPAFTNFHKRVLFDFVKFIDNPFCFENAFSHLYYCQSKSKPLQTRQRADLVKLTTILLTYMDAQNCQIGVSDTDSMKTVPHYSIRSRFEKVWNEKITKTKYYRLINLLKLSGYLEIEAVFIFDKDTLSNVKFKEGDLKRIHSKAAYKKFTDKFVNAFSRLFTMKDVMNSLEKAVKNRIDRGLNNFWEMYEPFSDSYYFKKRRNNAKLSRNGEPRYPQALA